MASKKVTKKYFIISTPMRSQYCSMCGGERPICDFGVFDKYSGLPLAYYGECQTQDCAHGWHAFVDDFYPQTFIERIKMFFRSKKVCKDCGKVIYV